MGRVEIEEGLKDIFPKAIQDMKHFSGKTYETIMEDLTKRFGPVLEQVPALYQEEGEKEETLLSLTGSLLDEEMEALSSVTSKRKKGIAVLDHNLALTVGVIPLIMKVKDPCMEQWADIIVNTWNERFPENKITKTTQDVVQGGFRSKLCYITTAVCESLHKPDDCYELTVLRDYRDEYLLKEGSEGKAIVDEYYNIAPSIVKHINKQKDADAIYQQLWEEYLSPCISFIEEGKNEACKEVYSNMVRSLQEQYFIS